MEDNNWIIMARVVTLLMCCLTCGHCVMYSSTWREEYDYVIVGGGGAGCVIAARLSEDPEVSVLLLEAGTDDVQDPLVRVPRAFHNVARTEAYNWGFKTEPQKNLPDHRRIPMNQARLLGGCVAHNAMNVIRGSPHDFDLWSKMGNKGWSYEEVLPYFKKSEDMQDPELANNGYHGVGGPWTTRLTFQHPVTDQILKAGKEMGFDSIDQNSREEIGFSLTQNNIGKDGRRLSTAEAFLRPVLGRHNLDVLLEAIVTKVMTEKCVTDCTSPYKTTGVLFIKDHQTYHVSARREVIVSGGAINSPRLLLLSGIGPKDHLKEVGIDVVADLPVGRNFQDHLVAPVWFEIKPPEAFSKKMRKTYSFGALLEYLFKGTGPWSSYGSQVAAALLSDHQPDEHKFHYIELSMAIEVVLFENDIVEHLRSDEDFDPKIAAKLSKYDKKPKYICAASSLAHPRTTGTIQLVNNDPFTLPNITWNYFDNPDDIEDLLKGIRFLQKVMKTDAMQKIGTQPFYRTHLPHDKCTVYTFDTDDWWRCYIQHKVDSSFCHFASTCKMSPDETGVVDDQLRVKGVAGLRVIDASIMPMVVSGHTMAPTIMIAEKGSDMIKDAWKSKEIKDEL